MTQTQRTGYNDAELNNRIYVGADIPPDSSWWAYAAREGFTAYAKRKCDRRVTTHGRKRGPEYTLAVDRPIAE